MSSGTAFRSSIVPPALILYVGKESLGVLTRRRILQQQGYRVTIAHSISQALKLFTTANFDLVISEFAGEAANAMIAEMKHRDPPVPIILLQPVELISHLASAGLGTDDAGVQTLLAKVRTALADSREPNTNQVSESEMDFSGVSEPLRKLLAVIVGLPCGDVFIQRNNSERAEAAFREFEIEISHNGDESKSAFLSRLAERIRMTLDADGVVIAFSDSQGLVCRARTGMAPSIGSRLQSGSVLTRQCFETGQVLLCEDAERDFRVNARSLRFRSAAVVPIQGWHSVLGVVQVFSSRRAAFDAAHVIGLARIARLLVPLAEMEPQRKQLRLVEPRPQLKRMRGLTLVPAREFPQQPATKAAPRRVWASAAACSSLALLILLLGFLELYRKPPNSAESINPRVAANGANARVQSPMLDQPYRGTETSPSPLQLKQPSSPNTEVSAPGKRENDATAELRETPQPESSIVLATAVPPPSLNHGGAKIVPPSLPFLAFKGRPPQFSEFTRKPALEANAETAAEIRLPPPSVESVPHFVPDRTLNGHSGWVTGVAFSADGQHLASGSWNRGVKFWDVSTGQELDSASSNRERVQALTFSRDGRWLAAENSDNTVTLWNGKTRQQIRTLPGNKPLSPFGSNWVYSIAFSPDGRLLASAVDNKTVRVWDVATGRVVRDLSASRRSVIYIAFSSDGRLLASGMDDKSIGIWDVASGRVVKVLNGHSKSVYAVAFSPDGRWLASAGADKTVKLWNLRTGREVRSLAGHDRRVTALAFSPDGRWLASGSWDKTVKLWDVDSGRELETLSGNTHDIYTVAFGSRGQWLASGSEDGTVKLWRTEQYTARADSGERRDNVGTSD
jgi:CheY-like chemotaxis protein/putative methionine-R-sulfoxide reductase with GAF domain/DNA-binding beta-propeller fold protein YncE